MAKIQITGNDIISTNRGKIGYFQGNDIYDSNGSKLGYFLGNDIYIGGRKAGYLEGATLYDERGRKVISLEKLEHEIQGRADIMIRASIYLLFLN